MAITKNDVEKIAKLARLRISEQEAETLTSQLSQILDYAAEVQKAPIEGVPPTAHAVALQNIFREDRARDSIPREAALKNAPQEEDHAFLVPRIVGEGAKT